MIECYSIVDGAVRINGDLQSNTFISLIDPTKEEIDRVTSLTKIDAEDLTAVFDKDELSRFEEYSDRIYVFIDVPYITDSGNFDAIPLFLAVKDCNRIAVCRKRTGLIERFVKSTHNRTIEPDTRSVFLLFLKSVIMEYQKDLRAIEDRRKAIEKHNHSHKVYEDDIPKLHDLESSLVYFSTSLNGLSAVLDTLKERYGDGISPKTKEIFDDTVIECRQAIEMANIYRDIMRSTRELIVTKINLRMNQTMKKLTNITITLTIPMIVTAAYGMNVSLPGQDEPWIFTALFAGTAILCFMINRILNKMDIL